MTEQLWAPPPPPPPIPYGEVLPELDLPGPDKQRRWTVLLRLLLAFPHYIVLAVLGFLGFFALVVGWFAALVLGRLPETIQRYLLGLLGYQVRVQAYATLLVDRYPPFAFDASGYPVQIELHPGELNRLAVLFRIFLAIPAIVINSLLLVGWGTLSFFFWLIALVLGRLPEPVFGATVATVRYSFRYLAYWSMLTSAYPKRLFGDDSLALAERRSASRPLILSGGAKVLVVVFLVLGVVNYATESTVSVETTNNDTTTVTTNAGASAH